MLQGLGTGNLLGFTRLDSHQLYIWHRTGAPPLESIIKKYVLIFQSTDFNILLRKQQVLIMNRKIQMTKRCIREALFECLKEKDINKITISSLCEKADINRSTFYKYYGSQYDVIKEMEQEVIKLINEQLNDQPKETSFIQLLQFLKANKETIELFFACNVDNEFPKQVLALDSINNQLEQVSQNDPYIKNYILFGSLATIQQWIDAGCIESCEEIADIINRIVDKLVN